MKKMVNNLILLGKLKFQKIKKNIEFLSLIFHNREELEEFFNEQSRCKSKCVGCKCGEKK